MGSLAHLPPGFAHCHSLGVVSIERLAGEFESIKAIYAVSPVFVPKPFAWEKYAKTKMVNQDTDYRGSGCKGAECQGREHQGTKHQETYFLLAEIRNIGEQPASLMIGGSAPKVCLNYWEIRLPYFDLPCENQSDCRLLGRLLVHCVHETCWSRNGICKAHPPMA